MRFNFRRIISRGKFIPEIDGLRFIAIISVVLFHIHGFIDNKDFREYHSGYSFEGGIDSLLDLGDLGVPLFFVISGFILALPFGKMYLKGGSTVDLKKYFLRRLTRLEPPYVLAMTILLFGAVYVAKSTSWDDAIWSYLASITYTHNFFYGNEVMPLLNPVAWSLEIEVQFYLLMPVLAMIFFRMGALGRRLGLAVTAVAFLAFDAYETLPFTSLLNFLSYFLIGILLADMYLCKSKIFEPSRLDGIFSLVLFASLWFFESGEAASAAHEVLWKSSQLLAIFLFYYLVLFHNSAKILAQPLLTDIGGMCYSIYLLHFPLISIFGNPLLQISFSDNSFINQTIYTIILLAIIFLVSSVFYLLIERPCMDKNWYRNFTNKLPSLASDKSS